MPANDAYSNIASDGQYVYFGSVSSLYRVPVSGGPAETVYSGPFRGFFAANGGTIAWVQGSSADKTSLAVKNASGLHTVTLPSNAVLAWGAPLVDAEGNVFFELQNGGNHQTWRWNPATDSATEMPGVGANNLYFADRGQIIWSSNAGLYATDVSSGTQRQLMASSASGFGSLIGLDASNVYGVESVCPRSACPFTVGGAPRDGGAPFVAYQTTDAYWTAALRADDSGLYWVDWGSRAIYHAAMSGGAPEELVIELTSSTLPAQFALDSCNLYWLDFDSAGAPRVMAIEK